MRGDYGGRLVDPRRAGWMLPLALLIPAAVNLFAVGLGSVAGEPTLRCLLADAPRGASLLALAGATLVFGPVPEEMAWRGYAMPLLLSRVRSLATASAVFGLYWAVWHVPLFLIPGTYQHRLGLLSGPAALFLVSVVATAFLYTWILTRTRGSILACILFHWSVNLSGQLLEPRLVADTVRTVLWVVLALVLVAAWRREAARDALRL